MKWLFASISDFLQEEYKTAYENMSQNRKKKVDRLMRDEDKAHTIAAEILLKKLLKDEFSIGDAVLENAENGCPYIKGSEIFVSISHSHNMVACAASYSPVGIDVEKIREVNLKISERFCTENEAKYLSSASIEETFSRFFEIWTAKEAYFKKLGTGITDLKSVDILSLKRETIKVDDYIIQVICDE